VEQTPAMPLSVDPATRAELARFDFDERLLAAFAARATETRSNVVRGHIEETTDADVSALPAPDAPARAELAALGARAMAEGEVGVVILAGGMATRFGGVVKAAVPVTAGRSFLDLKIGDLRRAAGRSGAPLPTFVMTSFATHDRIRAQIDAEGLDGPAARVECVPQSVSLRLTPEGGLFRDADGTLSPYATGHGDLSFALRASGALRRFREAGGKHLYVSNVDNLGATLDPAILGVHLRAGAEVTAEVVRKERGDRGGAAARLDGRPQIIEAFRFPADFDQDALPLFNTNSFVLDAAAIDRDFELTYFRVEKKVDGRTAVQFERLVGELTALLRAHFVAVPRGGSDGRFQPVKDPEELAARLPEIEHLLRARGVL
jgi:UTP--glucose-1-phosphate uridylyltransferase